MYVQVGVYFGHGRIIRRLKTNYGIAREYGSGGMDRVYERDSACTQMNASTKDAEVKLLSRSVSDSYTRHILHGRV